MKSIQHVGRVVDVSETKAEVLVRPADGGGCGVGCGCCGSGAGVARRFFVRRGELKEGDWARITMPACSGYVSTLVVFVLPMLMFIGGMIAGSAIQPGSGNDMTTVLGGVVGFALAIGVAVLVNKKLTGADNFVVERLDEERAIEELQRSSCSAAPE